MPQNSIDPQRDIADMDSEFILNDLIVVERKLERLSDERRKALVVKKLSLTVKLICSKNSMQCSVTRNP